MCTPVLLLADDRDARRGGDLDPQVMAPLQLVRVLVCWLTVGGGVMADPNLRQASETTEYCPRCDMIFSMLETDPSGERVQHIEMVERGESVCFVVRTLPPNPLILQ